MTQTDVVRALDWSPSKIHRIENGLTRVSTSDVLALLTFYGVTDQVEKDAVVEIARAARLPGISTRYKSYFSSVFLEYLDYEAFADTILSYQTKYVPGVIQNGGYAEAVSRPFNLSHDDDKIIAIADARNERAMHLTAHDGPVMRFVMDEAVLHRAVGGEDASWDRKYDTMDRLLDHLNSLNTSAGRGVDTEPTMARLNPNISIRVVPLEWGSYKAFRGPFVILEFDDPLDPPLVYLEYPGGEELVSDPQRVEGYQKLFAELISTIPSTRETEQILRFVRSSYRYRLEHAPHLANEERPVLKKRTQPAAKSKPT